MNTYAMETNSGPQLVILEHPVEKFRFRYKSEMHGTHGSLTGNRSLKPNRTFPEVELRNCNKSGIIRCSLYQTNTSHPSMHPHLLVVHKEEKDVCDPHDVEVSPELGYIVRFENMGIIHTAKKDVPRELLQKKVKKLKFDLHCDELTQEQIKILRNEADREAKVMNLNQVRLCFEAFEIVDGGRYQKLCDPVFSNPINNLKSAQTGELKICRLSIFTGSVEGNDDLILLVEKVAKNNIKVRFFEILNDEEVWEAYGSFTEADVHHQYAICVRTPPYRDKDIDNHVNVYIELIRESDNKRSTPVPFRYKPKNIVLSRKRRRTSYSSSNATSSPVSSFELPENMPYHIQKLRLEPQATRGPESEISSLNDSSSDLNDYLGDFNTFMEQVGIDSEKLENLLQGPLLCDTGFSMWDHELQVDGEAGGKKSVKPTTKLTFPHAIKLLISTFNERSKIGFETAIKRSRIIFNSYSSQNDNADTIVHDLVQQSNQRDVATVFKILSKLNLTNLLSQTNNQRQTPLHVACMFNQASYVRLLLELKCDANVQDNNGSTALHIAVAENSVQCMDALASAVLSSEINVNITNNDGMTPLHLAIRKNNVQFVKILSVKYNASVKLANKRDGNNALHLAVQQQSPEMVQIIIESSDSSHLSETNQAGHTAIDLAKTLNEPQREEILKILYNYFPSSAFSDDEPDFDESSSSNTEDDDKSLILRKIETEEVFLRKQIQKNPSLCKNLSRILSIDNKWQKLAKQLKVDHLLCIWVDAHSMMTCVVGVENIKLLNLLDALRAVDEEAAGVMLSFLTKNLTDV